MCPTNPRKGCTGLVPEEKMLTFPGLLRYYPILGRNFQIYHRTSLSFHSRVSVLWFALNLKQKDVQHKIVGLSRNMKEWQFEVSNSEALLMWD